MTDNQMREDTRFVSGSRYKIKYAINWKQKKLAYTGTFRNYGFSGLQQVLGEDSRPLRDKQFRIYEVRTHKYYGGLLPGEFEYELRTPKLGGSGDRLCPAKIMELFSDEIGGPVPIQKLTNRPCKGSMHRTSRMYAPELLNARRCTTNLIDVAFNLIGTINATDEMNRTMSYILQQRMRNSRKRRPEELRFYRSMFSVLKSGYGQRKSLNVYDIFYLLRKYEKVLSKTVRFDRP